MTNAEGFLFMLILFEIVACFIGAAFLYFFYLILRKIECRIFRFIIIILLMVLGFIRFMEADAPMLLFLAMALGVPMAVLIPPFVFSERDRETIMFRHILICFFIISVFEGALPFILVASGFSMIPFIYWHTPLSNGLLYTSVMTLDTGLAAVIFHLMNGIKEREK